MTLVFVTQSKKENNDRLKNLQKFTVRERQRQRETETETERDKGRETERESLSVRWTIENNIKAIQKEKEKGIERKTDR